MPKQKNNLVKNEEAVINTHDIPEALERLLAVVEENRNLACFFVKNLCDNPAADLINWNLDMLNNQKSLSEIVYGIAEEIDKINSVLRQVEIAIEKLGGYRLM